MQQQQRQQLKTLMLMKHVLMTTVAGCGGGLPRLSLSPPPTEPAAKCYSSRGRSYRGVVGVSLSGTRCLPWNSDLLHNELHVGSVEGAPLKGLGDHNYCR